MDIEDSIKSLEYREYENEDIQYLVYFFDGDENKEIHEFLSHSEFYYAIDITSITSNSRLLTIISDPEVYKKYYNKLDSLKETIKKLLYEFSGVTIISISIKPNLKKFQISANRYVPVITPWEEINKFQEILLRQYRESNESIDYQNIESACKMIMQKLAIIIFDIYTHKETEGRSVTERDYKNRLHAYIKSELGGKANEKIRGFTLALIDFTEKSVNQPYDSTHSLNAESLIAESCVISTISIINIISIIENNKKASLTRF